MTDRDFWTCAWREGRIRFHRSEVHPDLISYADRFLGEPPHRVLVPLCGKSLDLLWLVDHGCEVVGVELVPEAVEALHEEHDREAEVLEHGPFTLWQSDRLTVLQGDWFDLTPELLGAPIDRVWDRAAMIALPPERRPAYAAQVKRLAPGGLLLLVTLDYDTSVMQGPPFAVPEDEVRALYGDGNVQLLHRADLVAEDEDWRKAGHQWFLQSAYLVRL